MVRKISGFIGVVALVFLVMPSILFLSGNVSLDQVKWMMLAATLLWFVSAPFGMRER